MPDRLSAAPYLAPWLALGAALLYLLVPGHSLGPVHGLPLTPAGTIALLALPVLFFGLWQHIPRRLAVWLVLALLILAIIKTVIGLISTDHGLLSSYYDNSRFNGRPERSTEFRFADATRLDRELEFGGDEFPVYFFNDSERFNFYGPGAPQRRLLPFSVRWDGIVLVPADGEYRFRLTASGEATLQLGQHPPLTVNAEGRETIERGLQLRAGWQTIAATYQRRPPRSGDFKVEWDVGGRRQVLRAPYLRPPGVTEAPVPDHLLQFASTALDGLALLALTLLLGATLVALARRIHERTSLVDKLAVLERPLLGLIALGFVLYGTLPRLDRYAKMVFLGGGQDWLLHETLARDILLNGPLMTLGKALGDGRAYYAQPLYPYFLAALHGLTGEDLFGPQAVQVAGLGLAGVLLWQLASTLFDRRVAWATMALYLALTWAHLDWISRRLLSESIYFVLLPALLLALVHALRSPTWRAAGAAGGLLGLACLTRGTTLLLLPFAVLLVGRSGRWRIAGALAAVTLLVVALVPARNLVVTGRPALVATSGGVNMEKFHRPTPAVRLAGLDAHPVYNRFGLDRPTREVLEFIRQDPAGYAWSCLILAAYTVGIGAALDEAQVQFYPDLLAYSLIYLLTLVFARRARSAESALLHAFIGVHFLSMIVFTPYDYENRLVLPMFLPIIVFVAFGLTAMAERCASLAQCRQWTQVSQPVPRDAASRPSHG